MSWNYVRKGLMAAAMVLTLASQQGSAADIDLFSGATPTGSGAPNVLFVLDNSANFSSSVNTGPPQRCNITPEGVVKTDGTGSASTFTALDGKAGAVEQCALYAAISSMNAAATVTLNIGVMGFNANGMKQFNPADNSFSADCVGGTGGCLMMPIVPFDGTNKANMLEWIRKWQVSGGNSDYEMKANNTASGATMQEAWAYFKGKTGVSGRNYATIAPAVGCSKNTVIFIGNAYRNNSTPGDGTNEANSPFKPLAGLSADVNKRASPAASVLEKNVIEGGFNTTCGTSSLETAEGKGAYALNWARYMKGQDITTYSIGVLGPTCNAEYAAHLTKMGASDVGGGKYFPTNNYAELVAAIGNALSEIQAVNSVFAAVSLPVSVNTQGSYLNRVYIGMFRPDKKSEPRWNGNLKQYRLDKASSTSPLKLVDANGADALNPLTGFITECARSYWTPGTVDTYWSLGDPAYYWSMPTAVGCVTVADSKASNSPDGNIVEKGAQAFMLRDVSPASRNVKTCSTTFASCTSMTDFSPSNTTVSASLTSDVINWARGQNLDNELNKGTATAVMRPSVHGDVLHSRPMPINYGTEIAPNIVVYYGGNDGMLRAVNGNRTETASFSVGATTQSFAAGAELWSFMPPEFYPMISRLKANSPTISFPGSPPGGKDKDYGLDGPLSAYVGTSVSGSVTGTVVNLYTPMRRGGRALYAFDVTAPGNPGLLWKKGCPNFTDDTGCTNDGTGDFRGMGQTWSSAKPLFAQGYVTTTGSGSVTATFNLPMLIMGGGYDACEDKEVGGKNHNCTVAATKGNKVYVLDAADGHIVRAFDTQRAVVGDITIVRNSLGMAVYAYAADLGGNVYRIVFGTGAPATWSITRIASLGCDTPASCTDSTANRKFMFGPSVVTTDNLTYYVMLGSGDREKPVSSYSATMGMTNYFFAIKDKPSDNTWLTSENTRCGANMMCMASLFGITTNATPSSADLAGKRGWYLALSSTEQVVTSALTIFGAVTFSTHQPAVYAANSCSANLGTTNIYTVNYLDAKSANGTGLRYEHVAGDGLPPSPVGGSVKLDDGSVVTFCISCSKEGGIGVREPGLVGGTTPPKGRIYWFIQK